MTRNKFALITKTGTAVYRTALLFLFSSIFLSSIAIGQEQQPASTPSSVVEQLHSQLLYVMQHSEELGYDGRYEVLAPVIASSFDTPLIAKVILSRYWNELDDLQRESFIALFERLTIATYASRFDGYNNESFEETATEELRSRILIKTILIRSDKSPVHLDYLTHEENGKWFIISVIADGVNDLSLKRAEYAAVIKDKGYNGLVEDIRSKIHDMKTGS